ncbi:MAG TPA: hypothetical protein VFO58_25045, partial [Vicinamibacterales bacterium]|nr:hypothetical protein [Vicinamibacterales bacterium]
TSPADPLIMALEVAMRHASLVVLLIVLSVPASAQTVTLPMDEVVVHHDDAGRVRGRVVEVVPQGLVLIAANQRLTLSVAGVQRIDTRRDSVWNGAVIGALIGGTWCAFVCGQGLDGPGEAALAALFAAGVWGAAGAGIDALRHNQRTLYQRQPSASVAFRLKF